MLGINLADVINVITSVRSQLIAIGVIIVVAVAVIIGVMKLQNPTKKLIHSFS